MTEQPQVPISDPPTPRFEHLEANGLYNDRPARVVVKHEAPHHRIMIMLKAQGFSNKEIALALELQQDTVSHALRQPWAREQLLKIFHEKGGNAIENVLKGEAINSLDTLIEVRDDSMSGAPARVAASRELLDRYLGKPVQKIDQRTVTTNVSVEELDRRLERARAEEATLLGRALPSPRP